MLKNQIFAFTKLNSLTLSLIFVVIIGIIGLTSATATTGYLYAMIELMILAYSINLITGFSGYVNFGHVVYYGIGAYTLAVAVVALSNFGFMIPIPLLIILSGLVAASVALVIGFPVLRLRGDYFAIATLGINEAVRLTILNTKELGEGRGIYLFGLIPGYDIKLLFTYLIIILTAVILVSYFILKSRVGYGLRAINSDEDVAEAMGVNTSKYKLLAYALAAFFAGLAGGVVSLQFAIAFPEYFYIVRNIDMLIAMILGGAGTILGPLIGSVIYFMVKDALLITFPYFYLIIFGAILIMLVLFFPIGIVGLLNKILYKRFKRRRVLE